MWVKITEIFVFCVLFLLNDISQVSCHVSKYVSTPSNKVEQYCLQSDTCVHDTIPICGKMDTEMRTFLDLCDMLEYTCDTNQIYIHVEDVDDTCPKPVTLPPPLPV